MRIVNFILLLLLIFIGITFATLNSTIVSVNYYFDTYQTHLSLLLAIAFVLGGIVGSLVGVWGLIKFKLKNYRLKQRLDLAEKEIENLRAIPLQDKH